MVDRKAQRDKGTDRQKIQSMTKRERGRRI